MDVFFLIMKYPFYEIPSYASPNVIIHVKMQLNLPNIGRSIAASAKVIFILIYLENITIILYQTQDLSSDISKQVISNFTGCVHLNLLYDDLSGYMTQRLKIYYHDVINSLLYCVKCVY